MSLKRYAEALKEKYIKQINNSIDNKIIPVLENELPVKTGRLRRSIKSVRLKSNDFNNEYIAVYADYPAGIYAYINKSVRNEFNNIIHNNKFKLFNDLNNNLKL